MFKRGDIVVLVIPEEPRTLEELLCNAGRVLGYDDAYDDYCRVRFFDGVGSSANGLSFTETSYRSATVFEIAKLKKKGLI